MRTTQTILKPSDGSIIDEQAAVQDTAVKTPELSLENLGMVPSTSTPDIQIVCCVFSGSTRSIANYCEKFC